MYLTAEKEIIAKSKHKQFFMLSSSYTELESVAFFLWFSSKT